MIRLVRLMKLPNEPYLNRECIAYIMCNLMQADRFILANLTNPACDTLATLAKNLVVNKMNVHLKSSRMIAPIIKKAFEKFISQRHPLIIRALKSIPNGVALMRDQ